MSTNAVEQHRTPGNLISDERLSELANFNGDELQRMAYEYIQIRNRLRDYFCVRCATELYGPGHKASPYCESGKRPHCTCDTCF